MKTGWKGWIAALLLGTSLLGVASAEERAVTLADLGYREGVSLEGPRGERTFYFPLPRGKVLPGSRVDLALSAPPGLAGDSVVLADLEGRPPVSRTLGGVSGEVRLSLPLDPARDGEPGVSLRVRTRVHRTDDLCRDAFGGNLNVTLRPQTALVLRYAPLPVKTAADWVAALQNGVAVVLPDEPTPEEVASAVGLFARFSRRFPGRVFFLRGSEEAGAGVLPRVRVQTDPQSASGLRVEGGRDLLISGADGTALTAVARQVADLSLMGAAASAVLGVEESDSRKPEGIPSFLPLRGTLRGEGVLTAELEGTVYAASDASVPGAVELTLRGACSVPEDPRVPVQVDVLWNGALAASAALPGGRFDLKVPVPPELGIGPRNDLRLLFRYGKAGSPCRVQPALRRAELYPGSGARVTGSGSAARLGVVGFPLAMTGRGVLLVDRDLKGMGLAAAAHLWGALCATLPPDRFPFPEVRFLQEPGDLKGVGYAVAVSGKPLPEGLKPDFPLTLTDASTLVRLPDRKVLFKGRPEVPLAVGQVGSLAGVPSLALQAVVRPEVLQRAGAWMEDPAHLGRLSGNVFLFQDPGRATVLDTREQLLRVEEEGKPAFPWYGYERFRPYVFFGAWVLLAALLARLYFGQTSRRRGAQEEKKRRFSDSESRDQE